MAFDYLKNRINYVVMLSLFILPRKGLYQLTICQNCGYLFECKNCDAKLVTYRRSSSGFELFCHQCQTCYDYPSRCPSCGSEEILSKYGAIDGLVESLEKRGEIVHRLDKVSKTNEVIWPALVFQKTGAKVFATTRIFDPSLIYSEFDRIVFVQAENLLASPDYLVQEEVTKSLAEVFLRVGKQTELVFDIPDRQVPLIKEIGRLHRESADRQGVFGWYKDFLEKENKLRQAFSFPPHTNVLLLTTQEKQAGNAFQKLKQIQLELRQYNNQLPEITVSSPYRARFFRRKNMYSQHLLIKYPRQYAKFAELREVVTSLAEAYRVQVRLNPRHLF